jgi:hypothetical protein
MIACYPRHRHEEFLKFMKKVARAEWARVCGPLLSRPGNPDPAWARAQAARILFPEVNRHFDHGEARTLDLRPALRNVRCPTWSSSARVRAGPRCSGTALMPFILGLG